MTVTVSGPGLIVSDDLGAGPLPVAVTTICSSWPAASEPEAGVTVRPAGGSIVKSATGPPVAVRMNVPVAGPPVTGTTSRTTSGDAVSVPASVVRDGVGVGLGLAVGVRVGFAVGTGVGVAAGVAGEVAADGVARAGSVPGADDECPAGAAGDVVSEGAPGAAVPGSALVLAQVSHGAARRQVPLRR